LFALYVLTCIPCCYALIIFGPKWRTREWEARVGPSSGFENDSPTSCNGKETFSFSSSPSPVCLSSPNVEIRQEKREE
jgi:hypothetical protein